MLSRPMTRRWCCLVVALFIGPERAPAPIVEESPPPTSQSAASATPRPKRINRSQVTNEKSSTVKSQTQLSPSSKSQTSRNLVQGIWIGSFANDRRTIVVGSGMVSIDGGPMGRESGPIDAVTSTQVSWTTRPMSLPVKWTLTIIDGANSARVTTKHFLGGQTGSFQRKQ
ncbi:MAG: hypothetical protein ABR611_03250 [Chthoniobacterales bacterium]